MGAATRPGLLNGFPMQTVLPHRMISCQLDLTYVIGFKKCSEGKGYYPIRNETLQDGFICNSLCGTSFHIVARQKLKVNRVSFFFKPRSPFGIAPPSGLNKFGCFQTIGLMDARTPGLN
jgi:hypothetical protein